MDRVFTANGYYMPLTSKYYYYLKDHLGNTRVVVSYAGSTASVEQVSDYFPFGGLFTENNLAENKYLYNGKELNNEFFENYDYGARFYDPALGRFHTVDPLSENYNAISPYAYVNNNPILFIDPDGRSMTDFYDENDNLVSHVEDGSNAVFKQTGSGAKEYYKFSGFDENQGGENKINSTTAIQQQQILNDNNPDLEQDANGDTYCNYGVQNVMRAVASIFNDNEIVIEGMANEMFDDLASGGNKYFIPASQEAAKRYANEGGGLSIIAHKSPGEHGHILTYSVGGNVQKGEVANIGPAAYHGFNTLNGSIASYRSKSYYIFEPNLLPEVSVTGNQH